MIGIWGGGMLVEPNVDALSQALEAACSWSAQEQRDRGLASRRLVQQRYKLAGGDANVDPALFFLMNWSART